jgi:hypothetical protein
MKPLTTMALPQNASNQTTEFDDGSRGNPSPCPELYEQRGKVDGLAWDDWLQTET